MAEELTANPRRWYRRPRWIVLMAIGTVLVVGGALFAYAWANRGAHEASVDAAVKRFRSSTTETGTGGSTSGAFRRPAAGVYTYEGTGTEKISLLSTGQRWGPRIPATVAAAADGCWTFKVEYSTNHWQEWTYCPKGDVLQEAGGRTSQIFDFVAFEVGDLVVFTCKPPNDMARAAAEPGDSFEQSCDGVSEERGTHVTSAGTNTFVAKETVRVGAEDVSAYHYLNELTLSGDQTGTERFDTWYALSDGLPLKTTREVRVASPSPIGDVIYTEHGSFTLSSLEPKL